MGLILERISKKRALTEACAYGAMFSAEAVQREVKYKS